MATMITSDCINCGACEPECPNNAISQDEDIYVIDPLLCTECVGFHDYEACAAVCPVDCCVTDPNNIENEEVLVSRARDLHQDVQIGDVFESRFRKGAEKPAAPAQAAPKKAGSPAPAAAVAISTSPVETERPAPPTDGEESSAAFAELPDMGEWDVPIRCFKCGGSYRAPAKHFTMGNVLWCPHCYKSMVVKDDLNFRIRMTLREFYEKWERDRAEFRSKKERELREFHEKREKEQSEFEARRQKELDRIKALLETISESYDAPGRPGKNRSLFGWG